MEPTHRSAARRVRIHAYRKSVRLFIQPSAMLLLMSIVLPAACDVVREETSPVALEVVPTSSGFGLSLNAAPGVKINARLRPTLELEDGSNVLFDHGHLTRDSAYFADSPRAVVSGTPGRLAGMLRVSICSDTATYCQSVRIPIDLAVPTP